MASRIEVLSAAQSMTEAALSLPFCLLPILTVGIPKDGTSMMPLDELPRGLELSGSDGVGKVALAP